MLWLQSRARGSLTGPALLRSGFRACDLGVQCQPTKAMSGPHQLDIQSDKAFTRVRQPHQISLVISPSAFSTTLSRQSHRPSNHTVDLLENILFAIGKPLPSAPGPVIIEDIPLRWVICAECFETKLENKWLQPFPFLQVPSCSMKIVSEMGTRQTPISQSRFLLEGLNYPDAKAASPCAALNELSLL